MSCFYPFVRNTLDKQQTKKIPQPVENQRLQDFFNMARPKGLEPSTLRTGI